MSQIYAIACKIERGAFINERTFHISLSDSITTFEGQNEGQLIGTSHIDHLRRADKSRLTEDDPQFGEVIEGYVLCRKIRALSGRRVLAEVPSADVIHVSEDSLNTVESEG